MELTVQEALDLVARMADNGRRYRMLADEADASRDALIRELDGQPGMLRRELAVAAKLSKNRIHQIVGEAKPEREALADGVPMDQDLYDALVAVVGQFARSHRGAESVRLDVHA